MKFEIEVRVDVPSVGRITHRDILTFDDVENVFGRVLLFHQYMNRVFPGCNYDLINAKPVNGKKG